MESTRKRGRPKKTNAIKLPDPNLYAGRQVSAFIPTGTDKTGKKTYKEIRYKKVTKGISSSWVEMTPAETKEF